MSSKRDHRAERLRHKYKMTPAQYDAMWEAQGRGCYLCGSDVNPEIDHDHRCCPGEKTCGNCIRGILCRTCNTVLGRISDSIEWLRKAELYLS